MEETNEIDKLDLSPRAFRVVHGALSDASKTKIEDQNKIWLQR